MFHVARRVCEGCGAVRSLCGMFSCWFVCARLGLLLLAWWCCGIVVFVVVVGCLLFCCLLTVGGMGESMCAHFCCMMLLDM